MPRFLYLMRHAQSADKQPGQADKERELTMKGVQEATRIGRYLFSQKKFPKIIFASTANRANTTAKIISDVLKIDSEKIINEKNLYDASVKTFLEFIKQFNDDTNDIMCVGHNPTISYLAEYLTKSDIGDMPPAGIAIIQFQSSQWADSDAGTGSLEEFITPDTLNDD
jgi:phosphohistidine phosphatase